MPPDCLFCRIVAGEVPSTKVHEDDLVVAIRDVNPVAPVHVLVMPREHIVSIAEMGQDHAELLGRIVDVTARLARDEGIADGGYRVVTNSGRDAGQSVDHLHFHLLGGRHLSWPPG